MPFRLSASQPLRSRAKTFWLQPKARLRCYALPDARHRLCTNRVLHACCRQGFAERVCLAQSARLLLEPRHSEMHISRASNGAAFLHVCPARSCHVESCSVVLPPAARGCALDLALGLAWPPGRANWFAQGPGIRTLSIAMSTAPVSRAGAPRQARSKWGQMCAQDVDQVKVRAQDVG